MFILILNYRLQSMAVSKEQATMKHYQQPALPAT